MGWRKAQRDKGRGRREEKVIEGGGEGIDKRVQVKRNQKAGGKPRIVKLLT